MQKRGKQRKVSLRFT